MSCATDTCAFCKNTNKVINDLRTINHSTVDVSVATSTGKSAPKSNVIPAFQPVECSIALTDVDEASNLAKECLFAAFFRSIESSASSEHIDQISLKMPEIDLSYRTEKYKPDFLEWHHIPRCFISFWPFVHSTMKCTSVSRVEWMWTCLAAARKKHRAHIHRSIGLHFSRLAVCVSDDVPVNVLGI